MRGKKDFFTKLGEKLGLPREGLPGGFSAFFSGGNEVTVRGCRRILRYEAEIITLAVGKKREISVHGTGLICTAYNEETVTVTGDITALTLTETGKSNAASGVRAGGDGVAGADGNGAERKRADTQNDGTATARESGEGGTQ